MKGSRNWGESSQMSRKKQKSNRGKKKEEKKSMPELKKAKVRIKAFGSKITTYEYLTPEEVRAHDDTLLDKLPRRMGRVGHGMSLPPTPGSLRFPKEFRKKRRRRR